MKSYKEKLAEITTFVFDVDGVFTDGKVLMFENQMVRIFNSRDAYAVQYAAKMKFTILVITGGSSIEVKTRLLEIGATEVCLNSANKEAVYESLKLKYKFTDHQVLYMGDDIPDLPVLRKVGLSTCPQDATHEVKAMVDYQSPYKGGEFCVRDIIEQTLRVQQKWMLDMAFHW